MSVAPATLQPESTFFWHLRNDLTTAFQMSPMRQTEGARSVTMAKLIAGLRRLYEVIAMFSGCRVLLVEDELMIGIDFKAQLEELGASVIGPFVAVADATRIAVSTPLHAAILDYRVGHDEVAPVAEILSQRGIPFIFCSGFYPPRDLVARWPAAQWVSKPCSPEQLIAALTKII